MSEGGKPQFCKSKPLKATNHFWLWVSREGWDLFKRRYGRSYRPKDQGDIQLMGDLFQAIGKEGKDRYRDEANRVNEQQKVTAVEKLAPIADSSRSQIDLEPVRSPIHSGPCPTWLESKYPRLEKHQRIGDTIRHEYLDKRFVDEIKARVPDDVFMPQPWPKYMQEVQLGVDAAKHWGSTNAGKRLPTSYYDFGFPSRVVKDRTHEERQLVPIDPEEKARAIVMIKRIIPGISNDEIEAMFK